MTAPFLFRYRHALSWSVALLACAGAVVAVPDRLTVVLTPEEPPVRLSFPENAPPASQRDTMPPPPPSRQLPPLKPAPAPVPHPLPSPQAAKPLPVPSSPVSVPSAVTSAFSARSTEPTPASTSPATAPASPRPADLEQSYRASVLAMVEAHKKYPTGREAQIQRPTGTVHAWFELNRDGSLADYGIEEVSESLLLDQQTLKTLRGGSYPPFPETAYPGERSHRFTITLKYSPPEN